MLNLNHTIILATAMWIATMSSCYERQTAMTEPAETNVLAEQIEQTGGTNYEKATFAAGCFWGIQEKFRTTDGVVGTAAGYIGGSVANPTYRQVCTDRTGHAEAVEVTFDPDKITYSRLLDIFWNMHDPTTLNRQGPDIGTQYRSAIFYHNDEQKRLAEESKKKIMQTKKAVTQIIPAGTFWPAEEYHQFYLMKRGVNSCGIDGH